MFNNQIIAGSSGQGGFYDFPIEQSLRFNDDDSAYLSRTPASAGNRKTWTWSGWVKRGNLTGAVQYIASAYYATSNGRYNLIRFDANNALNVWTNAYNTSTSTTQQNTTSAVFRDVGAWYHIVVKFDSTQATASDRLKIYVNGISQSYTGNGINLNQDTFWNGSDTTYKIGGFSSSSYLDGYMAEVNFIDGQALDASSFGEFKSGIWVPVDTSGLSYGTNGFRLNFGDTVEASGFNAVTYTGNGGTQAVSGVGFEPDMVWLKSRSAAYDHVITDSVRGVEKQIIPNKTDAESQQAGKGLTSFDSDGFTLTIGSSTSYNNSGQTYVGWAWDAGTGSAASNTDGSITSTVKANTTYGFSIASYTGNATAGATIGHGLGVAPDMYIVKSRDNARDWRVYHSSLGATKALQLNKTDAANTSSAFWNNTEPTSSVFSIGNVTTVNGSGEDYIAYCFAEKAGYSKFGTYTGTGAAGNSITGLGFKPAFLLTKRTDTTGNWGMWDNTRDTEGTITKYLIADLNNAEGDASSVGVDFDDDGFTFQGGSAVGNGSGGTYIYMAFADTRDAAFWKDVSGQGNDWQHNNLTFSDVVPDSATNNFCTYNPNSRFDGNGTFSEGNLRFSGNSSGDMSTRTSTVIPAGMKFYFEAIYNEEGGSGGQARLGIDQTGSTADREKSGTGLFSFDFRGSAGVPQADDEGTLTTYGSQPAEGDVVGIAVDLENGKLYAHKANSYYNSGDPAAGTGAVITGIPDLQSVVFMAIDGGVNYNSWHINFGQDSTFAGRKSAGGNADENGYGDFQYAVPSGFLSLCSANLPTGAIDTLNDETPEDYFNTVLYSGNSTNNTPITVGFQPSMTWIKTRNVVRDHRLMDAVRGATAGIYPNLTNAEGASPLLSFDSDGFTLNNTNNYNNTGETYVAWNWKAGGAGVSNTDGSITSTVSASETSQGDKWFSIVKWTGNGTAGATVGHGLTSQPRLIITKNMDVVTDWSVLAQDANNGSGHLGYIRLNLTAAWASTSLLWNNTEPTSSVFTLGSYSYVNGSGNDIIGYCFANAEGLCKVGSYTGNGSADGTFVYTGFRPSFLLIKRTDAVDNWPLEDNKRNPSNLNRNYLLADTSGAEGTVDLRDFLSNGFKMRGSAQNASGGNYIYLAIAEQPFKFANAR